MSQTEDYELWVRLANDPSQSEEARQQYRERMAAYVHEKMRAAFRFATEQTLNPPDVPGPAPD